MPKLRTSKCSSACSPPRPLTRISSIRPPRRRLADPNVTYPFPARTIRRARCRAPTAAATSMAARFRSSPPPISTPLPATTPQGGQTTRPSRSPAGEDYAWAFFGCFLNVNDATNIFGTPPGLVQPVQHWLAGASTAAWSRRSSIVTLRSSTPTASIENPENSDKLAQRNLQVTTSGNPGFPATHRVPQTIDVRPSPPAQSADPCQHPELSRRNDDRLGQDAARQRRQHLLAGGGRRVRLATGGGGFIPRRRSRPRTSTPIQCQVVSPVTYIPIPGGTGGSFAGLLTVDLPATVRYGDEFDVVVRRITTRQVVVPAPPAAAPAALAANAAVPAACSPKKATDMALHQRKLTSSGSPVQHESLILPGDENLLAILKWRLGQIGPGNRWYPVLLRWISYLSGRIDGMGGNASQIPASPDGYQPPSPVPPEARPAALPHWKSHCGPLRPLWRLRGLHPPAEEGHEHLFRGREPKVEELVSRAWIERTLIGVCVEPHEPEWPTSIVLRRWK